MKIINHGCGGHMGRVVDRIAAEQGVEIVAGIDPNTCGDFRYPVFACLKDMAAAGVGNDAVIVDFSSARAVDALLDYCGETATPVVLCTTGLSAEQMDKVRSTSSKTAILKSANMSIGINLLMKLVKESAEVLCSKGFDVEIVEKHHRRKLDAPSGTALMLADAVNRGLDKEYSCNLNRSDERKMREHDEIGIVAVRGGNIVGEHTVIYAGEDEVIEITHKAASRDIFAQGAMAAAAFLEGRKPGLYDMSEVV